MYKAILNLCLDGLHYVLHFNLDTLLSLVSFLGILEPIIYLDHKILTYFVSFPV